MFYHSRIHYWAEKLNRFFSSELGSIIILDEPKTGLAEKQSGRCLRRSGRKIVIAGSKKVNRNFCKESSNARDRISIENMQQIYNMLSIQSTAAQVAQR